MRLLVVLFSLLMWFPAQANNAVLDSLLAPKQQTFLPVKEAFKFDFDQQGNTLFVGWDIADGYYLYKKNLQIIAKQADIQVPELEKGKMIEDEFFGRTEVYFNNLSVVSKLSNIEQGAIVKIRYQGCAEAGLCYPPEIVEVPLSTIAGEKPKTTPTKAPETKAPETKAEAQSDIAPVDNDNLSFTEQLMQRSLVANILTFFGLGIGLAFTPCVFPMFPILSSLIAGQQGLSTKKAFSLSFVYVQGMAVTYAALGLVVAYFGGQIQGYLQHPTVLISFSILFVALALSMFGVYEIRLPSGMMDKLTQLSNKQKGGNYWGVFIMGVLSGLIASPCTTAPLSGALLFVAQSGDYVVGAVTLYALSLGMGLPLLLLGTSGGKLLPKAGGWMDQVKTLFGFVMLFVPLILLERILDATVIVSLAGGLAVATALYLHYWQSQLQAGKGKTTLWGFAITLFIVGLYALKTSLFPAPTAVVSTASTQAEAVTGEQKFKLLPDLAALKVAVTEANAKGKVPIVDLYAEWCVACKEFEKYTFPKPEVQAQFKDYELLKLDLTKANDNTQEIMEAFTVFGLPTILIFDSQGNEMPAHRITGFLDAKDFAAHLEKAKQDAK
ncbi:MULTISPECIES: protein-disulfide reductase DsbD [unclassified Pseudoalteromonas]|uniref:protein-disulfide reductase DsbD n=1 Tax=unclassified Pseudoalteromonas TaxID=194690 RepID=UPI001F16A2BD|nr:MULTISPECIES: protein-disulfide reductase DsbD [unclassified Pseudoalteromonas]MCF2827457.1 protein-disulfide reductase DsbD [Pseudoalteromonas sp. OF5H-5]MCF2830098.1 protein-disulfide reductase DsbD [Pseudoalteromonas sp. DL2-H6]MCF2923502.1 protein-disulfide reductase DsbD [Pseudoalteromonas sp. DL2-H1]